MEKWVKETKAEDFRAKVCLEIGLRVRVVKVLSAGEATPNLTCQFPAPVLMLASVSTHQTPQAGTRFVPQQIPLTFPT